MRAEVSVTHRQYKPTTARGTLIQMDRGAFFFKNSPAMGTMTM